MTANRTYLRQATADTDDLQARFRPLFERVAWGNLERERSRVFPHDQVRWLNDAGLGTVRIPEEHGGLGASLEQTFVLLSDLGEADPNVSHIWRNHLAFVEDRLNAPVSDSNDRWIKRFLAGAFVGGGWTEAHKGRWPIFPPPCPPRMTTGWCPGPSSTPPGACTRTGSM